MGKVSRQDVRLPNRGYTYLHEFEWSAKYLGQLMCLDDQRETDHDSGKTIAMRIRAGQGVGHHRMFDPGMGTTVLIRFATVLMFPCAPWVPVAIIVV